MSDALSFLLLVHQELFHPGTPINGLFLLIVCLSSLLSRINENFDWEGIYAGYYGDYMEAMESNESRVTKPLFIDKI